jgi:hypothetical protein
MANATSVLHVSPVIPVVTINEPQYAVPLARALVEGGIRIIELTLRTDSALNSLKLIANEVPDILVAPAQSSHRPRPTLQLPPVRSFWSAQASRRPCWTTCWPSMFPCCPVWPQCARSWPCFNGQTWDGIRAEFTLPALEQVRRRLSELMEDPEP